MTQLRNVFPALLAAVLAGVSLMAAQSKGEVTMRAAVEKESVEGDVKGALVMYERAAKEAGSDRALAARALLAAGDAYRKMGDARARGVYERVASEFADQPTAVSRARSQLATMSPAGPVKRQLWSGPKVHGDIGTISRDGRLVSFIDWGTQELAVHDFTTGEDRLLTAKGDASDDQAVDGAISRDGRQVAYTWFNNTKFRSELRLVPMTGGSGTPPTILVDNPDISYVKPFDWSPDGTSIITRLTRVDSTGQIALVAVRGGAISVLETVDWRGPTNAGFSPDGKLVAYDLPVSETVPARDVFVISVDGTRKTRVVEHPAHDTFVGWSPDGRALLFVSDRGGTRGLWSMPIADGRVNGVAQLLRSDFDSYSSSLGVTASGALVFAAKASAIQVFTADIDFNTGTLLSTPTPVKETYVWDQRVPAWSPDGKLLAFNLNDRQPFTVGVHSVDAGLSRTLAPQIASGFLPRWSPHGALTFQGVDFKGRQGIFQIDPQTGAASAVVTRTGTNDYLHHPNWTADGKWLVYARNSGELNRVILRNWASGAERDLLPNHDCCMFRISPDGRWLAFSGRDAATKSRGVSIMDVSSGASRRVFNVDEPGQITNLLEWLPDSERLLVSKSEKGTASGWIVSMNGASPVRLDPRLPQDSLVADRIRVHPDGKRIAFDSGTSSYEVSALENFLPTTAR